MTPKLDDCLQRRSTGYHPFREIEAAPPSESASNALVKDGNGDEYDEDAEMREYEQLDTFPLPPPPGFDNAGQIGDEEVADLLLYRKGRRGRQNQLIPLAVSSASSWQS